jgi:hypothetical protein
LLLLANTPGLAELAEQIAVSNEIALSPGEAYDALSRIAGNKLNDSQLDAVMRQLMGLRGLMMRRDIDSKSLVEGLARALQQAFQRNPNLNQPELQVACVQLVERDFPKLLDSQLFAITSKAAKQFEQSIANFDAVGALRPLQNEIALDPDEHAAAKPVNFNITGQVVRLSGVEAEVDCLGGGKIVMLRSRTKGNWDQLQEGQWFSGLALICESGEVLKATITSHVSPPKLISDKEIDEFYEKILRAELTTENQKTDSQRHQDAPAYTITGNVVGITPTDFEVDWLGGERILVSRNLTHGKWNELQVGDWFNGVIVRRNGGEILNATLLSKIPMPEIMSDTQIEAFYSKLKPVRLSPTV